MNTNDFRNCKVGDKLWDHANGCECTVKQNEYYSEMILVESGGTGFWFRKVQQPRMQTLFFAKPEIIAPPEPIRLPDYKPGEWIVVWHNTDSGPCIRKFDHFSSLGTAHTTSMGSWHNHCTLADLPEVLAKWGVI